MILALRLLMTPFLIAAATLAGRRWGPDVSGWLIGFPLTSGPVSVILALQYGKEFAAQAAIGNLAGLASICAFCLAYSFVSQTKNWQGSVALGAMAFAIATMIWNSFTLALLVTFAIVLIAIWLTLRLIPFQAIAATVSQRPSWDLPARMIIATTFVLLVTALAPVLGPQLSGLITPFPVFGAVLAAFAHHQQGAAAARQLLRGMVVSLFGVAGFFLVVGGLLPRLGIGLTYVLATLVVVFVNFISLRLTRLNNARVAQLSAPRAR